LTDLNDPHAAAEVLGGGGPSETASHTLIILHGRGAFASEILRFGEAMAPPAFRVLAPQAVGFAWYPARFMEPLERNQPWLDSALALIDRLVTELVTSGIPRERVALGGFSQGACLALEYAARHPARFAAVLGFSGGLIGPPGTELVRGGSLGETPVLMGCSDMDPHIPVERVHETATALEAMGASVDERIYPGLGHTINDDELRAARSLLAASMEGGE
jgi:predicted esterase